MEWTKVAAFGSRLEAETVGHALDPHGIPYLVKVDDAGGVYIDFSSGASLLVPADRVEEVSRLLSCFVKPPESDED